MERKLAAIFSADVKGYSRLMGDDELATVRTLTAYREVLTTLIHAHRGRVVDSPGDNLLAEFASVVDAVECATQIQQELKTKNAELPEQRQMQFRIGINVGDVLTENGRLYGDGVNIAARLEGLADAGGICISEAAYTQVKNKLTLGYEYIGEQQVKNIAEPVRVYRVQLTPRTIVSTPSPEQGSTLALPDKPSIAVLPFTNMSSDPEQEYFSDGITEDLITDLSRLSGLFVIARNSTFTYKRRAVKVGDVGRELGVRYVLEGSVRKAGSRVRVTAQLVDATAGHHLWAERYDRELQDIFALQDEIRHKIVTTLKLQLTLVEQGILARKRTDNLEAYDYYLRGLESANRLTKEGYARALQLYEYAIALDPQYAEAYACMGWACFGEWVMQWSQHPDHSLDRAFTWAQQAVALDDSLSTAHRVLGFVYLWRDRQHERAIAEAERAIALDPNDDGNFMALGNFLNFVGRSKEAIGLVERAMRLNPYYPATHSFTLGVAYVWTGQAEKGLAALRKAASQNPRFLPTHVFLAALYGELGEQGYAQAAVAEILRLNPHYSLEVHVRRLPYKDPADLERLLAALRKAGLK